MSPIPPGPLPNPLSDAPPPPSPPPNSQKANPGGGAKKAAAKKGAAKKATAKKTAANKNNGGGKDTLTERELAREYGFGWKFFKQTPELWQLLQDATSGPDAPWSPQRFEAAFKATKWYKKHSDVYRQNAGLKYTDPATYQERLHDMQTRISNLANQWGADLTTRELKKYTQRAFMLGWDDAQILDFIAKEVRPDQGGHFKGELSGIEAQLREVAYQNGVRVGPKQLQAWMRQIVRGEADARQFETYIRGIAAQTFGAYGNEIRAGMNAMDVASPYIQSMADILELNPNSIGLDDRTIRKALTYIDPQTGKPAPMSVSTFEDSLRADKRFQYTDQAHEQLRGYAIELGKMWGVIS